MKFVSVVLVVSLFSVAPLLPATAISSQLTIADLTCTGMFLSPRVGNGNKSVNYPVAMRYESGARHYFIYDGTAEVYEFPEPGSLSPCSTVPASATRASLEGWGGDWGVYDVNTNSGDHRPGWNSTFAMGLTWDETLQYLTLHWRGTYSNPTTENSFAAMTLNSGGHTMSRVGCWGVTGQNQKVTGSGMLLIPSSFVSQSLPAGARWGMGQGYWDGTQSGSSSGPSWYASVPPTSNACAALTNYTVSGTEMEYHADNTNGPNCAFPDHVGCTPASAPTTPYPSQLAYTAYSISQYADAWDPYGGHGWVSLSTGKLGWYDDGVKSGVVNMITAPEGWMHTTVVSSASTTAAVITSTSTNDTFHANPGDRMWIQTCTPGLETGCDTTNGHNISEVTLVTVNNGTGAITFTIDYSDFGNGNHFPVPGGTVEMGCTYYQGEPTCSRQILRMQIFDPAQYAEVLASTRANYNVNAVEDSEIDTTLVTGMGTPSTGAGIVFAAGGAAPTFNPAGTIADTTGNNVIAAFSGSFVDPGFQSDVIYIFHVSHAVPEPSFFEWLWSMAPKWMTGHATKPPSLLAAPR